MDGSPIFIGSFSDNDDDPSAPLDESIKARSVSTPVAGTYTVTVVGTAVGVYSAVFSMNGNAQDASAAQTLENVPTSPGEVHTCQFTDEQHPDHLQPGWIPGRRPECRGGRFSDLRRTNVATDIVTASFHPAPGSRETVILPLVAGRNVLKLTVDGLKGTHTASDQDQLVFIVK